MDKSRGEPIHEPLPVKNDYRVRGKETPLQNRLRDYILKHPSCIQRDIMDSKEFKDEDGGSIRRAIRKMIESHKIIQRFSIK